MGVLIDPQVSAFPAGSRTGFPALATWSSVRPATAHQMVLAPMT
jgi:hypothetical protein